ncbi:MAG: Fic family protein [Gemmatimonadota bacterium]|nr:Fic family protein [Gemmatimonadota bacterium]
MRGETISRTWEWSPALYAPARYRRACRYEAFVPYPIANEPIELEGRVAGVVSDAEHAIGAIDADARPALAPLARLLLRTESIASSRIEGLQVGIRQLALAEARAGTGRRVGPTVLEVLGNIDAMELAVDRAASSSAITVDQIREIHRKLMAASPNPAIAGVVRAEQNWIGGNDYNPCGADYVPPPPEHVHGLLEDLCEAMADESLPPLVQAAIVHAQFETIHQFADGNGRAGRALIHVVLRRRGIARRYVPPISMILASELDAYIAGLEDFREGRVGSWIEHFATAGARAAGLASAYLDAVDRLLDDWRVRLSDGASPRADAAAWAIIDVLPGHPIITAPVAAAATGRSKAAIHQALIQLIECGVLEPVSAGKRNRSWEAAGLLDLLERLEGGLR